MARYKDQYKNQYKDEYGQGGGIAVAEPVPPADPYAAVVDALTGGPERLSLYQRLFTKPKQRGAHKVELRGVEMGFGELIGFFVKALLALMVAGAVVGVIVAILWAVMIGGFLGAV